MRITATVNDAAKDAGTEVSIQVTQVAPPADTPLSTPAAQVFGKCAKDITGFPARYELCAGCPDTRWYSQLGIPAFGFGAGRFDVSHGPNEYLEEGASRRSRLRPCSQPSCSLSPSIGPTLPIPGGVGHSRTTVGYAEVADANGLLDRASIHTLNAELTASSSVPVAANDVRRR